MIVRPGRDGNGGHAEIISVLWCTCWLIMLHTLHVTIKKIRRES